MKRTDSNSITKNIIAFDPSFTGWGYAVISSKGRVRVADCIKTQSEAKQRRIRKGDDRIRRIQEINMCLLTLIKEYDICYIVAELPHGSQSATAAVMLGTVSGMIQTIGDCLGIGVEWFSEGDSKKAILGKRTATKNEMIAAVKKRYEVPWKNVGYKDEAIADSMAIYHIALNTSSAVRMLTK